MTKIAASSLLLLSLIHLQGMEECPLGKAKGARVALQSSDESLFTPKIPSSELAWSGMSEDDKILVSKVKGLILVGDVEKLRPKGWEKTVGLKVDELEVPGGLAHLKEKLEPLFLGEPLTEGLLLTLKKEIYSYYNSYNRSLVCVQMPEQNVRDGVVQFLVIESNLGSIRCEGNQHFHCKTLKKYIHLQQGEKIRTDKLLNDIAFMNRSPYRKTNVVFASGKEANTTDIVLTTKDRFPFRLYTGGDNTGTHLTGSARWFGGLSWGNVFNWDHLFSYQYTRSTEIHKFQSHTFYYRAPTSWLHNIVVYGGFANIHPHHTRQGHGHGFSSQASGRYEIPLGTTWNSYLHQIVCGFDFKHTNNNLEFVEVEDRPDIFKSVNLTQFVLGYTYSKEAPRNKLSFELNIYGSPGEIMGGGSNHAFSNARKGAKNQYIYGRFSLSDLYHMSQGWGLYTMIRGQGSSGVLFPSEEFGLGGYNTVRGYAERKFNSDNMILANLEIHTPSFSVLKWFGGKKAGDSFYFLAFADGAAAWNYHSSNDEKQNEHLVSAGVGLRYTIGRHFNVRADYGFKLHKDSFLGRHLGQAHIGVVASY